MGYKAFLFLFIIFFMSFKRTILREIIEKFLKEGRLSKGKIYTITKTVCSKYNLSDMPTNVQLLEVCNPHEKSILREFLMTKPMRTSSGVTVITVVAKPADCPGRCIYCPRGENAPQSYTGMEPAIQRGIRNRYDPFLQVKDRLNQYRLMAHPTDKVELIIIGGTFLALPKQYKEWFICRLYDSLNGIPSKNLEHAKKINENSDIRCTGLTVETRADYCFKKNIKEMLRFGTTRVEIGLQSVYPEILRKVTRLHDVDDAIKATQLSKDSALKVTYHIMPGLFVDEKADLDQFKILFRDQRFRPDSLKIYPTLVVKRTRLYEMWERGEYEPLTFEKATGLIAKAMKYIPSYCRIIRVQRDIPATEIEAGVKKSNLREHVERKAEKMGIRIKEIRYREIGHKKEVDYGRIKLYRFIYNASNGKEIFLSFEDKKSDSLIAFLRLRIPYKPFMRGIDRKTALVRELHVYGPLVPVGEHKKDAWQHKGFGRRLLEKAEKIAREEFDKNKMVIISGVGIRPYYYQFGYKPSGIYVSKILK